MTDWGLLALARQEGIVPAPYLDVARVWTFGVGRTAAAGAPDPGRLPRGMPADLDAGVREALRLFRADLARYEAAVLRAVTVRLADRTSAANMRANQSASPVIRLDGPRARHGDAPHRLRRHRVRHRHLRQHPPEAL